MGQTNTAKRSLMNGCVNYVLVYGMDCKIGEKAAIPVNDPPEVDAVMRSL